MNAPAEEMRAPAEDTPLQCYKCKKNDNESSNVNVSICASPKCSRTVCNSCYCNFCETQKISLLQKDGVIMVTCPNKKCYNRVSKMNKDDDASKKTAKPNRMGWGRDGKNGEADPNNSLRILLDWIATEGNYRRYCGDKVTGKRKHSIANQLAETMNSNEVRVHRTEKDVMNKIQYLEKQFKTASDWVNNTGQGVHDKTEFDAAVYKMCPHYDVLKEIMEDRHHSTAQAVSDDYHNKVSDDYHNKNERRGGIEEEDSVLADEEDDSAAADEASLSSHSNMEEEDHEATEKESEDNGTEFSQSQIVNATPPPRSRTNRIRSGESKSVASTKSIASRSVASSRSVGSKSKAFSKAASNAGISVWSAKKKRNDYNGTYLSNLVMNQETMLTQTAKHHQKADEETGRHNRKMEQLEADKMKAADETARHNRKMEEIEEDKIKLAKDQGKWDAKKNEFEYKSALYKKFKEIRDEMSEAALLAAFPDMAIFLLQETPRAPES